MNRKTLWGVLILLNLSWIALSSCSKEDDVKPAAPKIELIHLGTHDSPDDRIIYRNEIHFEAKITAEALIQKINLEIIQKSGYGTYSFTKEYTGDYTGQKEIAAFHDHPTLAEDAPIGDYLFRLTVTDQQGQAVSIEEDVTVKVGEGGGEHEHEHEH
ncbi:DUF4625 domain-containing protein [Parapedobacter defluvii]|uniref:DUF4625 domain-containing protein n=1 Tax=Parapedobacter defluvii TaxID=2045106 RepID=UPI000F9106E5|nr:MAG: DUF4625 domain-containing protein [Parapedobacter sp.]